jgi:hypothetical protein
LVNAIAAPGTTAPLESVTVPFKLAVVCANAALDTTTRYKAPAKMGEIARGDFNMQALLGVVIAILFRYASSLRPRK